MNLTVVIAIIFFFSIRYSWSFFGGKRKISEVSFTIKFFRKFFELTVFLILPTLIIFKVIPNFKISNFDVISLYVGLPLTVFGLLFIFFARFERKKEWGFMGDKPVQLMKDGAYSLTRHPYYVGAILFIIGIYVQLNSVYILSIIPGIVFLAFIIKKEERELENLFQDSWREYKKKVGIIPFI